MKDLAKHVEKFSPYAGFMAFLYLNLLVGAVLTICAIAVVARLMHPIFHDPKVWNAITWLKYFN